ncbi:hypothetical protein ACFL6P_09850, partial [Candidatus Latescibacterota bacterium]
YAGFAPKMFPDDTETIEQLIEFCRLNDVRYIMFSVVEFAKRPKMRMLADPDSEHPGLEIFYRSQSAIVYRVKGI